MVKKIEKAKAEHSDSGKNSIPAVSAKVRKPYPSHEERLVMAEKKIQQLTRLVEHRQALLSQAEAKAQDRRDSLAKSEAHLQREIAKKEHILAVKNKPQRGSKRASSAAEKARIAELLEAMKASGKSVEDLLAMVKGE